MEEYIETALERLGNNDTCLDALQRLDSLLGQLCIHSNQMNLQSIHTSNKSFVTKTQKSVWKVWKVPNSQDEVFGEFVTLQDNFRYNITGSILQLMSYTDLDEETLILMNQVLQGVLLIHPPSRDLFLREYNMNLLLKYLTQYNDHSPKLITTVIQTFVCLLVRNVTNLRVFEKLEGPKQICKIFNSTEEKHIKHKLLEFLMFYLIPEVSGSQDLFNSKIAPAESDPRKSMQEKLDLLKPFLNSVDELINQLLEIKPFGNMKNIKW